MSDANEDRFIITAGKRTTGVVMTLRDVEVAVKMQSVPGADAMGKINFTPPCFASSVAFSRRFALSLADDSWF